MNIVKSNPVLINENKSGLRKFWKLHILQDGDNFYTQTSWWQETKNGESVEQFSEPYFCEPTNVGRSNERNSEAQAYFEFEATIKKRRDTGWHYEGEEVNIRPMPMLAHKFKDHASKINWPAMVQPKLNGMRMLFDGEVGWSRGNKEIIPEVIQHLKFYTEGHILDGELILPGNLLLQETMKAAKKYRPGLSDTLEFHVYDIVDSDLDYEQRNNLIHRLCENAPPNIKITPTFYADDEISVMRHHKQFVADGFEGTMIRNTDMKYEINKRSYSLLKLKDFVDSEYKIIDVVEGEGGDKGLAIFILETEEGRTFNCRPEGTQENRADLYQNREDLLDKYLTVRYFELSKDNIPIFPVGVGIRELGEFAG